MHTQGFIRSAILDETARRLVPIRSFAMLSITAAGLFPLGGVLQAEPTHQQGRLVCGLSRQQGAPVFGLMLKSEFMLRVFRFGLVGGTVTLFSMGLNWLLAPRLGADLAYLTAYPPTVLLHFCLSKWWTFRDQSAVKSRQVSEYLAMTLVAFLIQAGGFKLLTHFTAVPSWLASGIVPVTQMALAFFVMQHRVFASARN